MLTTRLRVETKEAIEYCCGPQENIARRAASVSAE